MDTSHIERPKLQQIEGTDLAYVLAPIGVVEKFYADKEFMENTRSYTASFSQKYKNTFGMKIYKMEGRTIDELKSAIKSNSAVMLGDCIYSATNQDFVLDNISDNVIVGAVAPEEGRKNLLLKSEGAGLKNILVRCGDVLASSSGEVLRKTKGSSVIFGIDGFSGFYYEEFFAGKSDPVINNPQITNTKFNFVDVNGCLVSNQNFTRSEKPTIHYINRSYKDSSENKMYSNKSIYPASYVYDPGLLSKESPRYFPSPAHLIIENRLCDGKGVLDKLKISEERMLVDHYSRQRKINNILFDLRKKYLKGTISDSKYRIAMQTITSELKFYEDIFSEFETDMDREIKEMVDMAGELDSSENEML